MGKVKNIEQYGWNGLKAQKLLAQGNGYNQHALKGQKLLAQGIALGIVTVSNAPCKGKSFINFRVSFKAFALTGRQVCEHDNPGRCPGLRASALSERAASMSFCPLPLLYPSARDFQFHYAPVTAGSGRAASMSFCPLPLLYPSASDFQFPSAGDRRFRAYWVISTIQVEEYCYMFYLSPQ